MADEDVLTMYLELPVRLDLLGPVLLGIAAEAETNGLTAVIELGDPEIVVIRVHHGK